MEVRSYIWVFTSLAAMRQDSWVSGPGLPPLLLPAEFCLEHGGREPYLA